MRRGHPYQGAPAYRRWRAAVGGRAPEEIDPVVSFPMKITSGDKVAAAGSCFAQHIARRLRQQGFGFLDAEPAHPVLPPDVAAQFQYGVYSARFGNIYTARQLLQLVQRAYGRFSPLEDVWAADGRWVDPFRPTVQPDGFASLQEYQADRRQHFAAVRRMLETMDVFIFTLGLTECWVGEDGAVFPVCPGVSGGAFDPARHRFVNLSVEEVTADMTAAISEIRSVNPGVKIILTVSPVPLAATVEDRHVLVSTAYSKAVLRAAAGVLTRLPDVHYFPSYEIVTATGIDYFADDRRNIAEAGVDRVMELFFRHVVDGGAGAGSPSPPQAKGDFLHQSRAVVEALCDEALLDQE